LTTIFSIIDAGFLLVYITQVLKGFSDPPVLGGCNCEKKYMIIKTKERVAMHPNTRLVKFFPLVLFLGILAAPAWGASEKKDPVIEPRARQVLQQAGDFMKSAQNFTFTMETVREIVMKTGQGIQYSAMHEIAVRKPGGVKVISDGDLGEFTLWYDGSNITVHNADRNIYSREEVPNTIDAAFDHMAREKGITPPMVSLLYSDPIKLLKEKVNSGFYVGLNQVRGVPCHHLAFSSDNMYFQIWIAAGLSPVILKVVLTYKEEKGAPQFTAYLSDWDLSPFLPDSLFKSVLPKNALLSDIEKLRAND
jgi:hypothetical protein